jgi:hypothetical protein
MMKMRWFKMTSTNEEYKKRERLIKENLDDWARIVEFCWNFIQYGNSVLCENCEPFNFLVHLISPNFYFFFLFSPMSHFIETRIYNSNPRPATHTHNSLQRVRTQKKKMMENPPKQLYNKVFIKWNEFFPAFLMF